MMLRDQERQFQEARLREDREWRAAQEVIQRELQERQSRSRFRWEIIIFGILVTAALVVGQIFSAFIERGGPPIQNIIQVTPQSTSGTEVTPP